MFGYDEVPIGTFIPIPMLPIGGPTLLEPLGPPTLPGPLKFGGPPVEGVPPLKLPMGVPTGPLP